MAGWMLVTGDPADAPAQPRAEQRLSPLQEHQLPLDPDRVFTRGDPYVLCLSDHVAESSRDATLSPTWTEVGAILHVVQTETLAFALASPVYRPDLDALISVGVAPDDPFGSWLSRDDQGRVVARKGPEAPAPCVDDLGDRVSYALSQLDWAPDAAGPGASSRGPRYAVALDGARGARTLQIFEDGDAWFVVGADGGWLRAAAPRTVWEPLISELVQCR